MPSKVGSRSHKTLISRLVPRSGLGRGANKISLLLLSTLQCLDLPLFFLDIITLIKCLAGVVLCHSLCYYNHFSKI